jgi:predicted esterase
MPRDPHRDQPVLRSGAPLAEARGVMILAHGRGGSAQDMIGFARMLERPEFACFVPEAAGRAWYPYSFLEKLERNQSYLTSALKLLRGIFGKIEAAGLSLERTVLIGFSQGACVVLELAARNARRYGGIAGLSGGLIGPEGTARDYEGSLDGTPVFLGCSDVDPHIPKRRVDETETVFARMGAAVTKRIYPGLGHTINEDEIAAVRAMLDAVAVGA